MLMAQIAAATTDSLEREIHRLGKWAAVVLIEVHSQSPLPSHIRALAPNGMLAHRVTELPPGTLSDWAHVGIGDVPAAGLSLPPTGMATIPWIACRRLPSSGPLAEAAEQCRRSHAELARSGSCVGCFV